MPPVVRLGRLWLRTIDRKVQLRCWLGATEPKVVGGRYGGWSIVNRPRKKGLTEWVGNEPLLIEIELLIDDWEEGEVRGHGVEIEQHIRNLERMAGLDASGADEPPLLHWDANAPHDHHEAAHLKWFIENLTWGSAMRNSAGNRVRQEATIQLREYVADDYLRTGADKNKAKKKKRKKPGSKVKRYRIKQGDTLFSIAKKYLGSASRWKEIAKLNNLRDPRKLPVGKVIKLP